jgi:phosphonate transport system ATP-binding protein
LHQVDAALAHFPRIVGLREGQLLFDLPSDQVTQQLLAQLYAQHEHELRASSNVPLDPAASPVAPVVMHCR